MRHNSTGASLRGSSLGCSAGTDVLNQTVHYAYSPKLVKYNLYFAGLKDVRDAG